MESPKKHEGQQRVLSQRTPKQKPHEKTKVEQ